MPFETDVESIDEIKQFLKNIFQISLTFKESNGIVDCNGILKLFKYETRNEDSGFESEPISTYNDSCFVPTAPLKEIIFEENHLDLILENCLIAICNFIQNTNIDKKENQSKIDTTLDFVIQFVEYLAGILSNVPFREIIQTFLESMLTNSLADNENESMFNFVMKLFKRFAIVQELQECILDLIMKNLRIFAESIKIEGVDSSFSFHYQTDFNRANTLLLTLLIIKKCYNCSLSLQHDEEICNVSQTFAELDDFFTLGFLSYKCLLQKSD